MGKIVSLKDLKKEIIRLKKSRKKIIFTNGCFDVIHIGHIRLFKKAKSAGDILIAAVNSDKTIRRLKGKGRPIIPAGHRMEILSSIKYIDYVVEFSEDTPLRVIKELMPHIVVKGADWQCDKIVGRGYARIIRAPLVKNISTTGIIKKIAKSAADGRK